MLQNFIHTIVFTASSIDKASSADLNTILFPPRGKTLDQIQNKINNEAVIRLSNDLNWFFDDIRQYGYGLFVEEIDFTDVDQNRIEQLKKIDVIVFDLDSIRSSNKCSRWIEDELAPMLPRAESFLICQTSQQPPHSWNVIPLLTKFRPRIYVPDPEVFVSERILVDHLKQMVGMANVIAEVFIKETH